MDTLIVGDIHLGAEFAGDDEYTCMWLFELVCSYQPKELIFLGDTFHLNIEEGERYMERQCSTLHRMLHIHEIFTQLKDSSVEKLIFIAGEEDNEILKPELYAVLKNFFHPNIVEVHEVLYDSKNQILMAHGHQLDQSIIFHDDGKRISFTDKYGKIAREKFLFQSPSVEEKIKKAFKSQVYSYWYEYPTLSKYIKNTAEIFSIDTAVYLDALKEMFSSKEFKDWENKLRGVSVRSIAKLTRFIAKYHPPFLLTFYCLYHYYSEFILNKKRRMVLKQTPGKNIPYSFFPGKVKNLILAHRHYPMHKKYPEGDFFTIPASGRLHTGAIKNGMIRTTRYYGWLGIENGILYFPCFRRDIQYTPIKEILR